MQDATIIERIRAKFRALNAVLDERSRRQWAAAEALEYGYGGLTAVAAAPGLARATLAAGIRELEYRESHPYEPVLFWASAIVTQIGLDENCEKR